jgi:flagellar protein FlgJ
VLASAIGESMVAAQAIGTTAPQAENEASPRLMRAAHQFEGLMMKELLKPLTSGDGLTGEDDDSDSGAGSEGALSEYASEVLGQAMSEGGGFGIANQIIGSLSHSGNQGEKGKVTKI